MKHIIFIQFLNNDSFKLLNIKFLIEIIFVFKKILGSDYQTKEVSIKTWFNVWQLNPIVCTFI